MTIKNFSDLGLAGPIQRALSERNHATPTPIQSRAIPELLRGRDLLGIAQTGTGKTGAFALPILHKLSRKHGQDGMNKAKSPRALILAPTRELAIQIGDEFGAYGKYLPLRHTVIFGGVNQKRQVNALAGGVDIVIATPGRLLDLMNQRHLRLGAVECLVLDEADRMLDMGFVRDVRKIVAALPETRQSLLFSATMPAEIRKLSNEILNEPVQAQVAPQSTPIERIKQSIYHVPAAEKAALLADIMSDSDMSRVIVFTRTKHRANRVADKLGKSGVTAEAIHGNKSQSARQRALKEFRDGNARVLVATDIAARGIDVDGVTHVINFELPNEPESYVHRIGRTARAGASGQAIAFCDPAEREYLEDIERLIECRLTVIGDAPAANDGWDKKASGPKNRTKAQHPAGKPGRKPRNKRRRNGRKRASNGERAAA